MSFTFMYSSYAVTLDARCCAGRIASAHEGQRCGTKSGVSAMKHESYRHSTAGSSA